MMFLSDEQKRKYRIMSRSTCERYCSQNHTKTAIIVSIKSSWDKVPPHLYLTEQNKIIDILYLSFDDITYEDDPRFAMTEEDGEQVAKFINKYYDRTDTIIVHCDGGVSRSAGVCAAIMRVKEGSDSPVFDNRAKHPNMTCYLRTLRGFGYDLVK